jgi:folate-binding protein YgfZ
MMSIDPIGSFRLQYDALRSGRGAVLLAEWSSVTLTGADRQAFVHNFCTNDVKRLAPSEQCEAFFTNVKGKIVGHGLITCRESELVVIGLPQQAPGLIEHLDRYVIREDVQLRDTTTERSYLLIAGDGPAREVLSQPAPAAVHEPTQPWRFFPWNLINSESAGLIELAANNLSSTLDTIADHDIELVDLLAFHAARIEAGVPLFGVDFNDSNLPQEVGRDREAISFTKGCYLGQETVARIDALGHVNQQLVGVRFLGTTLPDPGMQLIHDGRAVGHVTSATYSPQLDSPLALAMLRREHAAIDSHLQSPIGESVIVPQPL